MDSSKDSAPKKNTVDLESDGQTDKSYKSLPTQAGVRDNAENLFTTTNRISSFVPSNGSQVHMNPTSCTQQRQRTNKGGENSSETNKTSSNSAQSEMCNKVTKNNTEQMESATAGGSGSVPNTLDSSTENSQDVQSCQRHKICIDKTAGNNLPSTSGMSRANENPDGGSFKESRKRPSSLKLNRSSLDEDSSSDTGTEDYSLGSEDGCIYTYRGGEHLADLPSSFFSLDMGLPLDRHLPLLNYQVPRRDASRQDGRNQGSRASSPDMEFLEMDFDPGPSCEVDTGDELSPEMELEVANHMPEENEPVLRAPTPEPVPPAIPPRPPRQIPVNVNVSASTSSGSYIDVEAYTYSAPTTSQGVNMGQGDGWESHHCYNFGPYITHVNTRGEHLLVRRTMARGSVNLHVSSRDKVSPRESNYDDDEKQVAYKVHHGERRSSDSANLLSEYYHLNMMERLMADKKRSDFEAAEKITLTSEAQNAAKAGDGSTNTVAALGSGASGSGPGGSGAGGSGAGGSGAGGSGAGGSGAGGSGAGGSGAGGSGPGGSGPGGSGPGGSGAGGSGAGGGAACVPASGAGALCVEPPRSMVWSEAEACERQVTQIAISASGATAVVNVFIALGVPVNLEKINSSINTRLRAHNAPLPRYLLSRAVAGCTAAELVSGIHGASDGLVTARFFATFPERAVSLSHWLADWITLGAVPILTLNLQVGCDGDIPDSWQHQMVFGVSPRGIYVSNPVECVRESALWPQLTSPSVLLVRTKNILARFAANTDLTPLMAVPDRRFLTMNVLGQVANVIRESRALGWGEYGTRTRHIRLPAAGRAGVTVCALSGSEAQRRLLSASELPLLAHTDE